MFRSAATLTRKNVFSSVAPINMSLRFSHRRSAIQLLNTNKKLPQQSYQQCSFNFMSTMTSKEGNGVVSLEQAMLMPKVIP